MDKLDIIFVCKPIIKPIRKNIIINNQQEYLKAKKKYKKLKINIYNKLIEINKILQKNKIYYSMV